MSHHHATTTWTRQGDFLAGKYSRLHQIAFDGGTVVPGSAAPGVVPLPYSVEAAVDPEEMFVASLSACHMLWFLDLASRAGLVVETYSDAAEGTMARDPAGKLVITKVVLRPRVTLSAGDMARVERLHHAAHEACFIANSVKTEVLVELV